MSKAIKFLQDGVFIGETYEGEEALINLSRTQYQRYF